MLRVLGEIAQHFRGLQAGLEEGLRGHDEDRLNAAQELLGGDFGRGQGLEEERVSRLLLRGVEHQGLKFTIKSKEWLGITLQI